MLESLQCVGVLQCDGELQYDGASVWWSHCKCDEATVFWSHCNMMSHLGVLEIMVV